MFFGDGGGVNMFWLVQRLNWAAEGSNSSRWNIGNHSETCDALSTNRPSCTKNIFESETMWLKESRKHKWINFHLQPPCWRHLANKIILNVYNCSSSDYIHDILLCLMFSFWFVTSRTTGHPVTVCHTPLTCDPSALELDLWAQLQLQSQQQTAHSTKKNFWLYMFQTWSMLKKYIKHIIEVCLFVYCLTAHQQHYLRN